MRLRCMCEGGCVYVCAESESEIKSRVAVDRLQEKKTRRQTRRRRQTKKSRAAERERDKAMLVFFSLSLFESFPAFPPHCKNSRRHVHWVQRPWLANTHTLGGNTSITKLLVERHICVCFLPHEFRAWLTPPGGTGKSHFSFSFLFFFFLLFHPCD